jgi:hypothetical protein
MQNVADPQGEAAAAPPGSVVTDGPPAAPAANSSVTARVPEIGGPSGPEPTRYGDWEKNGRCIDF